MYYYTSALRWPLEWIPRGDVWIHAACSYAISPSTETWPPSPPPADATSATSRAQSMDQHGAIILQPLRPNTIGLIPGGRTTYFDIHGVCNAFLTCHALTRAFVFGPYWDEIDISRSHLTSVLGSWSLTRRPRPVSHLRFHSDRAALESDLVGPRPRFSDRSAPRARRHMAAT